MWVALWSLIVVGTLVGAFLVGRRLWFSARELGVELARAADVTAQLADKVDELQRIAAETRQPVAPDLFGDHDALRARAHDLRVRRAVRKEERIRRLVAVARGWRAYWS